MKFLLEIFIVITGVGAASGLFLHDDTLFIVSDDSNYLYQYDLPSKHLHKTLLVDMDGENENVQKKKKLDLESITKSGDNFWLFASGSKLNRNQAFQISALPDSNPTPYSVAGLYDTLRNSLNIGEKDFNIEGSIMITQDSLLLFNRGNGPNAINGIIALHRSRPQQAKFTPIQLPAINGNTTGFTDAILVNDNIYFLAAAEGGSSSYSDGKIGGSQIGRLNVRDLSLESIETISTQQKFEGITLQREDDETIHFLLCDDPDNGQQQSTIYALTIYK